MLLNFLGGSTVIKYLASYYDELTNNLDEHKIIDISDEEQKHITNPYFICDLAWKNRAYVHREFDHIWFKT